MFHGEDMNGEKETLVAERSRMFRPRGEPLLSANAAGRRGQPSPASCS
jgi:hypothetical protein